MKLACARQSERRGFTLVELMVVIAIIGLLVSMLTAAVYKAVATGNRVKNQNEISQISTAVEAFKQKFGIYPPSRLLLAERLTDYTSGDPSLATLRSDSLAFLTTIFPRLNFNQSLFIDWDGNKSPSPPVILEGDQCLVFFLGGIPQTDANGRPFCSGFSTNPANPAYHVLKGGDTIPPFFEFDSTRLVPQKRNGVLIRVPRNNSAVSQVHFSYLDTYGNVPYAYFSSYKTRNGYNRFGSSDCDSLGVWPYADGANPPGLNPSWRYLNPNTFQIISAGANGQIAGPKNMGFGRGSDPGDLARNVDPTWTPTRAGSCQANRGYTDPPLSPPQAGIDDQSNFYDTTLGTAAIAGS